MKVVILGNGIAGVMTAAELRKLLPRPEDLAIDIYTREPYDYYSRIRLPEVISGNFGPDDIRLYKPGWYAERSVTVHKGETAVAIDRAARRVSFVSGASVPYDKLVIALGADCFRPPLAGGTKRGVFTLREYADADALRRRLRERKGPAAVVGGGLLGLEAARHIAMAGADPVTVVEIAPRLLPRQLDAEGASLLGAAFTRMGIKPVLGAEVASITGLDDADGIVLKAGGYVPARTILLSMGVRSRTAIAHEAGLDVNRGIVVNSHLQTTDPDIFAVGDEVEFSGVVWGIIPAAMEHAPVVADAIAGTAGREYVQTIPRNSLKVAGIDLTSIGKVTFDDGQTAGYDVLARSWNDAERYEKFVLRDGLLAGAIMLGSKENVNWALASMGQPVARDDVSRRLGLA